MKRLLFSNRFFLAGVAMLACASPSAADLNSYDQSFENLLITDSAALGNDGWLVFGNVFDGETLLYGYGVFPAPNHEFGFSAIDANQGGVEQGTQQLSVYSDYNNGDHANGFLIESNVFQEQIVGAADVGTTCIFQFDAKLGNLAGSSTALGFIKTLDPMNGHALTNFVTVETTTLPVTWGTYLMSITIDASLVGQLLQFGFLNTATLFEPSGIFYDNVSFNVTNPVDAPEIAATGAHVLSPASPNPFRGSADIQFTIPGREDVRIDVFDVRGRRVARLLDQAMPAGQHNVSWSGLDSDGKSVASGTYFYRMETNGFAETRQLTKIR